MTRTLTQNRDPRSTGRLSRRLRCWLRWPEPAAHLDAMPDHLLRDIGVRRDAVRRAPHNADPDPIRLWWP